LIVFGCAENALENKEKRAPEKEKPSRVEKIDMETMEKERAGSYSQLQEIFQNEQTKEKIGHLKKIYGDAIDSFLSLYRIRQTIEAVQEIDKEKEAGGQAAFVNKEYPFAMTPGSRAKNYFDEFWADKKAEQEKETAFSGFENIEGLSNEKVRQILEENYSKEGLAGSIKEIRYVPEVRKKGEYDVLGEAEGFSISSMAEKDSRAPLRLYQASGGQTAEAALDVLNHEIAHAKNWNNSKTLKNHERVNFLHEVTQRFAQEDRFKSEYVETIVADEDKNLEAYKKVSEYWGEIVREYAKDKEKFRQEHSQDAQLVEKWIKK
jgi:hypothetical protein